MPIDTPFEHDAVAAACAVGRAAAADTIASTTAVAAIAISPNLLTIRVTLLVDVPGIDVRAS